MFNFQCCIDALWKDNLVSSAFNLSFRKILIWITCISDKLEFMLNGFTVRNKDVVELEYFIMHLFRTHGDHRGHKI